MNNNQNLAKSSKTNSYSVQEVSQQLSIPENTLRKYLLYFELEVERIGRKNYLSQEIVQCLSEILQLKSNSWSLKQIKAFRDAQKNRTNAGEQDIKNLKEANISEDHSSTETETSNFVGQSTSISKTENYSSEELPKAAEHDLTEQVIQIEEIKTTDPVNQANKPLPEGVLEPAPAEEIPVTQNLNQRADNLAEPEQMSSSSSDNNNKQGKFPLTRDFVNKLIAIEAKRTSRLHRFLSSRASGRELAEANANLNRRVEFLNGLRYLRDNWLSKQKADSSQVLSGVS